MHIINGSFVILSKVAVAVLNLVFDFVQANVICIVYSVEDFTSVEKVLILLNVSC